MKKRFVFALIVIAMFSMVAFMQSQMADDQFGAIEKRADFQRKMTDLRAELEANGATFTVDYNPAMQYTIDQLCNFRPELGPQVKDQGPISHVAKKPVPPPTNTSYIADYTSVKNQGSCGSCWAFSTAGMFESVLLKQGINVDLSEQWLVSCNNEGWGCNGGWFANDYYLNPGAVLESCMRYKAADIPCVSCPSVYIATGEASTSKIDAIKAAIETYGAVHCAVTVTTAFQAYNSGVFNYDSSASVNHAVVLVGWDDELGSAGAWRMKNSWGTGWGESGLMWIEYGVSNIGYGANHLKY